MTQQQKVSKNKLGLLKLAKTLGSVSEACKVMRYSRDSFYCKERPHSGRYCYGKTPYQTFIASKYLAKEKVLYQLHQKHIGHTTERTVDFI